MCVVVHHSGLKYITHNIWDVVQKCLRILELSMVRKFNQNLCIIDE
jgi:hypothetical protein